MSTLREAAKALVESEQAWGRQYGDARCIWCNANPADEAHGDGCEFGALVRALESETREAADLAEIERMITNLESFAWKDGHDDMRGAISPECRAARSALLQRVEALREERDAAAAQSFSGHDWNRLLNERDAARAAQKRAEEERDEARDALNAKGLTCCPDLDLMHWRTKAKRAETALAALRAAPPDAMREALRDLLRFHPDSDTLAKYAASDYRAAVERARALAPAPPAALRPDPDTEGGAALRQPDCYCSDLGKHPLGSRGCKHQRIG